MVNVSIDFAGLQKRIERTYTRIAKERVEERAQKTLALVVKALEDWVKEMRGRMSKLSISRGYDKKRRLNVHSLSSYNNFWPMLTSGRLMNSIKASAVLSKGRKDTEYKIKITKRIGPAKSKRGFDYAKWLDEEHMYLSGYKDRAYDMIDSKVREIVRIR